MLHASDEISVLDVVDEMERVFVDFQDMYLRRAGMTKVVGGGASVLTASCDGWVGL